MRTGRFYSFSVIAECEVPLPEHYLLIDPGVNHFLVQVEDVDAFVANLQEAKVRVLKQNLVGATTEELEDTSKVLSQGEHLLPSLV